MIVRYICPVTFDANDNLHIASLIPPINKTWDKSSARTRVLKTKIRTQLAAIQNNCAYCGLEIGGTSGGEIDHIAPKGKHPEFTYTEANLIIACDHCNGPKKKHQKETIGVKNVNYQLSTFLIVHPYFDDPNTHYNWIDPMKKIVIEAATPKGQNSINMFELDSSKMTRFRAIQYSSYIIENDLTLDEETEQILKQALKYK